MVSEEVLKLIEDCVVKHSAHVIDVTIRGSQHKSIVEIFVDADAGVTSDLCSTISRDVAEVFDARDIVKGSYQLVVSSPGIDRPLKFPWQYKKHIGRKLVLKVRSESGLQEQIGKLLSVEDEAAWLEVGKGNEQLQIRFDAIHEAVVKAPW